MVDPGTLYCELRGDLDRLVGPLFEFAEQLIRKRGTFLPFGATLSQSGEMGFKAATSGEEVESCLEVLPILHDGLRANVREGGISAIAVCEWVKVTLEDGQQTDAMKILVEHELGLTIAFYVPCHKNFLRGWQFEEMFVQEALPEVRAWDDGITS